MKLIGLLSFYDEPVKDLVACLTSCRDAGVEEVVAVDGAYALYPDGKPASPSNQHAAIVLACRELALGLTLHVPWVVWEGNEVEKRTFLFRLALAVSQPGDWFWINDADEVITNVPDDLEDRLEATEHDCAEIEALDTVAQRAKQPDWPERFTMRRLFRAQPITVRTNHITYMSGDGRLLWGYEDDETPLEPALDLTRDVLVEHRPDRRPPERLLGKMGYYAGRDASRAERGTCAKCGEPATKLVPTKWRMTDLGPVAAWMEACNPCGERVEKVNRRILLQMGVNPDGISVENRMGRAPVGMTR